MIISRSKLMATIMLLPLGYSWATRLRPVRDVGYLVASSWIPAIWVAWRGGTAPLHQIVGLFAIGYLAFISLYEIGYLVNDSWDARRNADGRDRGARGHGPVWTTAFVSLRVSIWLAIAWLMGWSGQVHWIAGYAALASVFLAHNLLRPGPLRLSTFAQLATLRFCLPLMAVLDGGVLAATFTTAVLVYLPLRYLSYADSKGLVEMPERGSARFGAAYLALTLPMNLFAAWMLSSPSIVEASLLLIAAHSLWAVGEAQRKGAKP